MRDNQKYFPVNWMDGMKISKTHFIQQDNAQLNAMQDIAALHLSPIRYGVLPASAAGEESFNVKISFDNQESVRVAVLNCQAITNGGVRIAIPSPLMNADQQCNNTLNTILPFKSGNSESTWWVFLFVHPFEKQAAGSPDLEENPPRFPHVLPTYTVQLISDSQYRQYASHPYALAIGKLNVNGNDVSVENDYIPACISCNAHPDLLSLHAELDRYMANIELNCSQIVQKILRKSQQNDISELVMFLCDRVVLYLGQAITSMRINIMYEPPADLFAGISALARIMKNTIDLRIGSGKDELMNYLSEWCELKQGELETMLSQVANMSINQNDINASIHKVVGFVKVTSRLFDTLSKLEFIGKRKESGIFVKEESPAQADAQKGKRRFFG